MNILSRLNERLLRNKETCNSRFVSRFLLLKSDDPFWKVNCTCFISSENWVVWELSRWIMIEGSAKPGSGSGPCWDTFCNWVPVQISWMGFLGNCLDQSLWVQTNPSQLSDSDAGHWVRGLPTPQKPAGHLGCFILSPSPAVLPLHPCANAYWCKKQHKIPSAMWCIIRYLRKILVL